MTDVLTAREGVNTERAHDVAVALTLPVNESMFTRVARFGFEYEMFPPSHRNLMPPAGNGTAAPNRSDWEPDDDAEYDDFYVDDDDGDACNCWDCRADRAGDAWHADAMARWYNAQRQGELIPSTVNPYIYGRYGLVKRVAELGLIVDERIHEYHCRCSPTCSPTRTGPLMTAQNDSSVAVEFVSRILDLNRDWDSQRDEIQRWINAFHAHADEGGWMPDGDTSCGNHVHVSKSGRDAGPPGRPGLGGFDDHVQEQAQKHINALYAAFDWEGVADGGCGKIRGYNSKPEKTRPHGSWLSDRGYATFEHRLWNTPADPDRLWAHLGLSLALTRWAFALAEANPAFTFWNTTSRASYGGEYPAIDDETWDVLTSDVDRVVAAVAAYIPPGPEFAIAHTVLDNLRVMR